MNAQFSGSPFSMKHETPGLKESHKAELERWKAIRTEKIARSIREEREARERRERLKEFDAPLV